MLSSGKVLSSPTRPGYGMDRLQYIVLSICFYWNASLLLQWHRGDIWVLCQHAPLFACVRSAHFPFASSEDAAALAPVSALTARPLSSTAGMALKGQRLLSYRHLSATLTVFTLDGARHLLHPVKHLEARSNSNEGKEWEPGKESINF